MSTTAPMSTFHDLKSYLSACKKSFDNCISHIDHGHQVKGISATTRMHFIRYDGNGRPMIEALAECLYQHVIDYCISSRTRQAPLTNQQYAMLVKEARRYFVHPLATPTDPDRTGEAGECLLYLLLEAVLEAPQMVAKMELKANPNDEVKGSDGIHMRWDPQDNLVEVYFGEAKLHKSISSAIGSAFTSIENFHQHEMCRHELKMVTKHFKYADPEIQEAVNDLLRDGTPGPAVRIKHACLIGYDWANYPTSSSSSAKVLTDEFIKQYHADGGRLHDLLQSRFDAFGRKHLRFDVFFLPFPSVQQLRDAFNRALG